MSKRSILQGKKVGVQQTYDWAAADAASAEMATTREVYIMKLKFC